MNIKRLITRLVLLVIAVILTLMASSLVFAEGNINWKSNTQNGSIKNSRLDFGNGMNWGSNTFRPASEQNNRDNNVPQGEKNGLKTFLAAIFAGAVGTLQLTSTKRKKGFFGSLVDGIKSGLNTLGEKISNAWESISESSIFKGVVGALEVIGGALMIYVGVALCATGAGAIIGAPMIAFGAASVIQGGGNIYYAATGQKKEFPNFMQESMKWVGRKIGGEKGERIANIAFFVTDIGLGLVGGGEALVKYSKYLKEAKSASQAVKVLGQFLKEDVVIGTIKGIKNIPKAFKEIGTDIKNVPKTVKGIVNDIKSFPKRLKEKFLGKPVAEAVATSGDKIKISVKNATVTGGRVNLEVNNANKVTKIDKGIDSASSMREAIEEASGLSKRQFLEKYYKPQGIGILNNSQKELYKKVLSNGGRAPLGKNEASLLDIATLSRAAGDEFAVIRTLDGTRWLIRGIKNEVSLPANSKLIIHTHSCSVKASVEDFNFLLSNKIGQKRSSIITFYKVEEGAKMNKGRFFVKEIKDGDNIIVTGYSIGKNVFFQDMIEF